MAPIMDYLNKIKTAIYGQDVRQAIHDAIQQVYYDGKAGSIDLEARQNIDEKCQKISFPKTVIAEGQDILALPPGEYRCETGSIAASLVNCPTKNNFKLIIEQRQGSTRYFATIKDSNAEVYYNSQFSESWCGWKKIVSVDCGSKQSVPTEFFTATSVEGITPESTKTLADLGIITEAGSYVVFINHPTITTENAASAYFIRYSGSSFNALTPIVEGTANRAPRLTNAGVLKKNISDDSTYSMAVLAIKITSM